MIQYCSRCISLFTASGQLAQRAWQSKLGDMLDTVIISLVHIIATLQVYLADYNTLADQFSMPFVLADWKVA